jgi:hypothetical protein
MTHATKTKTKRRAGDAYFTPQPLANAMTTSVSQHLCSDPKSVLEPSAGGGAFVNAALNVFPTLYVKAIDIKLTKQLARLDGWRMNQQTVTVERQSFEDYAREFHRSNEERYGLIIGNPPYKLAAEHVQMARGLGVHVAFLLRLSFLGSQTRAKTIFTEPGLRFIQPVAQRPKFIRSKKSGDNSEYAVFMWQSGYRGGRPEVLPHLWVES